MTSECLVIGTAEWNQLMRGLGWLFLLVAATAFFGHFDLSLWEHRIRRYLRRRRISKARRDEP